jgi:hypothetical protein
VCVCVLVCALCVCVFSVCSVCVSLYIVCTSNHPDNLSAAILVLGLGCRVEVGKFKKIKKGNCNFKYSTVGT